jgi:hypothetical protein
VSLAYAPHPAFGLVGQGALVSSRRTSGSGTKVSYGATFGASADLDLERLWRVPIALLAVYRWAGAGGVPRLQDYGGGVFYSRRVPLQLGLEVVYRSQYLRPDVQRYPVKATVEALVLRYYW